MALALAAAAVLALVLWAWQRGRGAEQALQRKLASGEWRLEQCPACFGRGACRQCGGMGTLGLMGKPCPSCGGGEQEENGRLVTLRGSGQCAQCGGAGQVYRITSNGATLPLGNGDNRSR